MGDKTACNFLNLFCDFASLYNELNSDFAPITTHEKNLATLFAARQVQTWVVKRTTSLFNSFRSNVVKQVARFHFCVVRFIVTPMSKIYTREC